MNNTMYKVVFEGQIADGRDIEDVKNNLVAVLNKDFTQIEKMLSGQVTVIRENADYETCEKAKASFEKSGAMCSIMPMEVSEIEETSPRSITSSMDKVGTSARESLPTRRTKENDEKFCSSCGERIKVDDPVCAYCGQVQIKKGGIGYLGVGAIIVGFCFLAMPFIAIIAAVSIPNFIKYKHKAMENVIKAEMENLSFAESNYFNEHYKYSKNYNEIGFVSSNSKIRIEIIKADKDCFEAIGTQDDFPKVVWYDCNGYRETALK
ncbi:MAG: zinc ribbon domain-containing protein [Desulfobacterales bacterium]|nr:zinc ribbon domain-containing protein [Desulfobacterales bacterium]